MIDLKQIIKDLNLNQNELSLILGVSQTAISMVSNGKMDIPPGWVDILRDHLGVDISNYYIMDGAVSEPEVEYIKQNAVDKLINNVHELIKNNEKLIDNNTKLVEANTLLSRKIVELSES